MGEPELWAVQVDRQALLLGVDIGHTWVIVDAHASHSGANLLVLGAIQVVVVQETCRLIALPADGRIEAEAPISLVSERELLAIVEVHLVLSGCSEGHEDIVLVVEQVVIRW